MMKQQKYFTKISKTLQRAKEVSKEKGVYYVICVGVRIITNLFWYYYYKIFKRFKSFTFQGKTYRYFYHIYNTTWRNERSVEVPIIWDIVRQNKGKKLLEVGNVLSHYFSVSHDVVDKYEEAEGVLNQDIINFSPNKKYDLIVSISTLEHVGWDENPREPNKILRAIEHLKNLLAPGGKLIVTLPLGYNPEMDKFLKEGKLKFDKQYYLKRKEFDEWIETSFDEICDVKYGEPFPNANGLVIGIIEKK